MKHTYMSSNFTKKDTSLYISFNCNCPFRSSFLLFPSLKGHSQLCDRADLDTTFASLKSVYLNPKSNVRVGYI